MFSISSWETRGVPGLSELCKKCGWLLSMTPIGVADEDGVVVPAAAYEYAINAMLEQAWADCKS